MHFERVEMLIDNYLTWDLPPVPDVTTLTAHLRQGTGNVIATSSFVTIYNRNGLQLRAMLC